MSWIPIGSDMVITKVKNKRVFTINNQTVSKLYKDYLGVDFHLSSSVFLIHFPLMVNKDGENIINSFSQIFEDGSAELIRDINLGEHVRFSFCDTRLQLSGANKLNNQLLNFNPEAVYTYTCGSRKTIFGDDYITDMKALNNLKNSCGFYSYGEFFTSGENKPLFLQQTMTVLAFSEVDNNNIDIVEHKIETDIVNDSNINSYLIQKVLVNLVMRIASELDEKNQILLKFAHYDGLTNLSNRRMFDNYLKDNLKIHSRNGLPFTLILIDVDFFKLFNDTYGHVNGDICLKKISDMLKDVLKRPGDMAFRYGGEEFACVLSGTDSAGANFIANKINKSVEGLKIPHKKSSVSKYVTVSIGVLNITFSNKPLSSNQIIEKCDTQLYKAKNEGRNCIRISVDKY